MQSRYNHRYYLAFDDGYFPPTYKARRGKTTLLGVLTRIDETHNLLNVFYTTQYVDDLKTTQNIIQIVNTYCKSFNGLVILLDGITYCGFDVADPDEIYSETGFPVITVQQYPLDLNRIYVSLKKHFIDYEKRFAVIKRVSMKYVFLSTPWKTIQFYAIGIPVEEARFIIVKSMIYSPVPEPLRIAHMLASELARRQIKVGIL